MKTSVKEGRATASKKRSSNRVAKIADPDLAHLAQALQQVERLELAPPQPDQPQHDPTMWSRLFGMWN